MSLGLTDDFRVVESTAEKRQDNQEKLKQGDANHINIRYVPNNLSKGANDFLERGEHYGAPPVLKIEFYNNCDKMIELTNEEIEIPADKPYTIGRNNWEMGPCNCSKRF